VVPGPAAGLGELERSDFGATFALPFVADTVRLVVQVQGTRQ
jgi:hypothetical protein